MILDWTCMTCGKKGTAVHLGSVDGKSREFRVQASHHAAQGRNSRRRRCLRPNLTWQTREMRGPNR